MEYRSETNRPLPHQYAMGDFKKNINKYEDLINKHTGKLETKVTDTEDFYEKIQSHKDAQLLDSIIKRYQIDIDEHQIKEITDDIVDMTNIPTTMTEAYSMIKQVENEFDQRPAEIKKAFNNNVGEYVAGIQNGKLKQIVEEYKNKNGIATEKPVQQPITQPVQPVQQPITQPVQPVQQVVNQETIQKMVEEQIKNSLGGNSNV